MSRRLLLGSIALLAFCGRASASVEITSAPTHDMNCGGGICTPTAKKAVLNATDLANMLASGDVTVETGTGVKDIVVKAGFGWVSANRLTLDAYRSVIVQSPIAVRGPGGLTLTTRDGAGSGAFSLENMGNIAFWDMSSSLAIDGTSYSLVSNVDDLASGIAGNSAGAFALAGDFHSTASYTSSPVPTAFTGRFEGLGHRVFYLSIDDSTSTSRDGLFATIGAGGSVRDIGLVKARVRGSSASRIGTLAGENDGTIANSFATGRVDHAGNGGYLGGLVGWNTGSIMQSYSEVSVRGAYNVSAGGLVGTYATPGPLSIITFSHASGDVRAGKYSYVGGLVGTNTAGTIASSYASGTATAGYSSLVGGFAGQSFGNIIASFASGAVSVGNRGDAGGLVGLNQSNGTVPSQVIDVYATGNVSGQAALLGSLFGACCFGPNSVVNHAYGIGAIGGAPHATIGGVVGDVSQQGTVSGIYWDTDTTGVTSTAQGAGNIANDPGLTALTDAQLKSGLPSGFGSEVWGQSATVNNGYPYLLGTPPPE